MSAKKSVCEACDDQPAEEDCRLCEPCGKTFRFCGTCDQLFEPTLGHTKYHMEKGWICADCALGDRRHIGEPMRHRPHLAHGGY